MAKVNTCNNCKPLSKSQQSGVPCSSETQMAFFMCQQENKSSAVKSGKKAIKYASASSNRFPRKISTREVPNCNVKMRSPPCFWATSLSTYTFKNIHSACGKQEGLEILLTKAYSSLCLQLSRVPSFITCGFVMPIKMPDF